MRKILSQVGATIVEIAAIIAVISILTLVGSSYYSLVVAKSQLSQGFTIAQNLINEVNNFYTGGGNIHTSTGNLPQNSIYDNNSAANSLQNYASRFVKEARSYKNGVVEISFNGLFDYTDSDSKVGAASNVASVLAGKRVGFIPFYTASEGQASAFLRWACVTTVNFDLASGNTAAPFNNSTVSNPLSNLAEGCLVVSDEDMDNVTDEAMHLEPQPWLVWENIIADPNACPPPVITEKSYTVTLCLSFAVG
jgi:Tfp pilus assembly protein PilE